MTGLWPQHHGSREVADPFTDGTTLAEVLRKNGYANVGVSANWVASRKQNMQQGFHAFISMKRVKTDDRARFVTDRALELSRLTEKEKPLFLWVHYMDPHFPYNPPKSYRRTPPGKTCKQIMRAISDKKLRLGPVQGNREGIAERILEECSRRYKLVEFPQLTGGYARALYDLEADPAEVVNVIDEHSEVAARLSAELAAWSASIPTQAPPPERDQEQLEMLRALGYVD